MSEYPNCALEFDETAYNWTRDQSERIRRSWADLATRRDVSRKRAAVLREMRAILKLETAEV
jgi:hypothetical protein